MSYDELMAECDEEMKLAAAVATAEKPPVYVPQPILILPLTHGLAMSSNVSSASTYMQAIFDSVEYIEEVQGETKFKFKVLLGDF